MLLPKWRFFIVTALAVLAACLIFLISVNSILIPVRWFFGFVLSLILPGYCLLQALFPQKEMNMAEMLCLVPSLSFLILALDGLLVNFLFGNLDVLLLMLFLSGEILTLNTIAAFEGPFKNALKRKSS
jgi:uncharacterized membrane protein